MPAELKGQGSTEERKYRGLSVASPGRKKALECMFKGFLL
jgi:hypothetical protein